MAPPEITGCIKLYFVKIFQYNSYVFTSKFIMQQGCNCPLDEHTVTNNWHCEILCNIRDSLIAKLIYFTVS